MAVADRGTKRRCSTCGAPFYDLNKAPAVCPKCHNPYVAATRVPVRALRGRTVPSQPAGEEAALFEEDAVPEHVDEDEDGLPPDADEAGSRDEDELRD